MKTLKWILIVLVLVVAVGVLARNEIVKKGAIKAVRQATGFDLEVGTVHVGLFSPTFHIDEVKLINPDDFPEATAFDIRQIQVRYDFASLFSDRIRLKEVILDVPTAVMVVKEDGESNLDRLRKTGSSKEEDPTEPSTKDEGKQPESPSASKPSKSLLIDRLTLKLGTVHLHRYVEGQQKPEVKSYDLKIDRTYEDVTSVQQIGALVATEIAVRELPNLAENLDKLLKDNKGDLKAAGESLKKTFEGLFK
jgi:uncharacterized protein involved in outer membrane biogenesis